MSSDFWPFGIDWGDDSIDDADPDSDAAAFDAAASESAEARVNLIQNYDSDGVCRVSYRCCQVRS